MFVLTAGQNNTSLDAGLVGATPVFGFALKAGAHADLTEGRSVPRMRRATST